MEETEMLLSSSVGLQLSAAKAKDKLPHCLPGACSMLGPVHLAEI
jgi:hypothetical protein